MGSWSLHLQSRSIIWQLYMYLWYGGKWDSQTRMSMFSWGLTIPIPSRMSCKVILGASSFTSTMRSWLWTAQYWLESTTLWRNIWSLFILQSLGLFLNPGSFCLLFSLKHARILFQLCALKLDFRPINAEMAAFIGPNYGCKTLYHHRLAGIYGNIF